MSAISPGTTVAASTKLGGRAGGRTPCALAANTTANSEWRMANSGSPTIRHSLLAICPFALLTFGNPLALERLLRVDHRHAGHLRVGTHRRRVVMRAVEGE